MFTLEEIYSCTREEFCERTGISMSAMMIRLQNEVMMLETSLAKYRAEYRSNGKITDDEQRRRAKLIKVIENKIESKTTKVKDIKQHLEIR